MVRRRSLACVVITLVSAVVALALGWGFTVDDALISTRVAHHLATGVGYRFNPGGPLSDCVTPLGWAPLIAPLAHGGVFSGLLAVRWLGVALHLATATLLGWVLARGSASLARIASMSLPLAVCLPWGAWASAGMETPLLTLLCTATLLGGRWTLPCASLAAMLRPELLPWAFVLGALTPAAHPGQRVAHVALALCGAALAAVLRASIFGHPAPLAVFAKPSDFEHGVVYLARGLLWCGLPLLLLGGRAYRELPELSRRQGVALVAHFGAVVVAGGDWMALFRLLVPVLPACLAVAVELTARQPRWFSYGKWAVASGACLLLAVDYVPQVRGVLAARHGLIEKADGLLRGRVVGTLDVGWVGATGASRIVDFAGVTDLEVALLPGGHTSKRLPPDLLHRRRVDTLVLLLRPGAPAPNWDPSRWRELPFARRVEWHAAQLDGAAEFAPVELLPLPGTGQNYLVLQRPEAFARGGLD